MDLGDAHPLDRDVHCLGIETPQLDIDVVRIQPPVRLCHAEVAEMNIDSLGLLHRLVDSLQAHPQPAIARQFPAQHPELDDFLHIGGVQHGNLQCRQQRFALVDHSGGFSGVIVTHRDQHAAVPVGAKLVAVAHHVRRTVYTGCLAIPHGVNTVDQGIGEELQLLGTPDRSGSQVLVDAGLEYHAGVFHPLLFPPQGIIQHAQGGATITADKTPGIQPIFLVQLPLDQGQSGQGLGAADKYTAIVLVELIGQLYVHQRWVAGHGYTSRR